MHERPRHRTRHYGVIILRAAGLLLLGGALLSWSWNASISELFGMPRTAFRQAVAAEVFIGIIFATVTGAARLRHHGQARPGRGAAL